MTEARVRAICTICHYPLYDLPRTGTGYGTGERFAHKACFDLQELEQTRDMHLGKLELQEGDTLVVRSQYSLSQSNIQYIQESFEINFPGRKVVVLSNGLELGILRPEKSKPNV